MASIANKFAAAAAAGAFKKAMDNSGVTKIVTNAVNNATGAANKAASANTGANASKPKSSVENVVVSNSQQQAIKDQMAANSQAWRTADAQERARLEQANKDLAAQLGGPSFDSGSGTWSGAATAPVQQTVQKVYEGPSYSDLLKQQQDAYDEIQRQQEAAKRAAVEQAVGALNRQKDQVGQSYSDLFRQLYIDRRMAEKKLPQQMAAMGYYGGLTESSALGLKTSYADALRQGEQEKISTLADMDQAISDARLKGDISIAELAAQNAKDKLASYTDIVKAMQDQANADRQYAMQKEQFEYGKTQDQLAQENWLKSMNRQELLDQLERDDLDYNRKLKAAQYLFENSGDATGLKMLGYTDSQIDALQKQWAAALVKGTSGSTGGTGSYKPKLTLNQVLEQINAENFAPQVMKDYEYWMGETYTEPVEQRQENGMNEASFGAMMRSITMQLQQGKVDTLLSGLESVWPKISSGQRMTIQNLLRSYGYDYMEG